jgi:outer membrane protein assembly factor BamB
MAGSGAWAAYVPQYAKTADLPQAGANSDRGINVNGNVGSPYYGYVYVCDSTAHTVRILKPEPTTGGDSNTAPYYKEVGAITTGSGAANPHDVFIGPDDTVWLCSPVDRDVRTAPPVPAVEGGTVAATLQFQPTNVGPRSIWVTGSLATGARVFVAGTAGAAPAVQCEVWDIDAPNPGTADATPTKIAAGIPGSPLTYTTGPYGITVDTTGTNIYIPRTTSTPSGTTLVDKWVLDAGAGTLTKAAAFVAATPAFLGATNARDVFFVADTDAPGGVGYLYVSSFGTSGVFRFALTGTGATATATWLDGVGQEPVSGFSTPEGTPYTYIGWSAPTSGNKIVPVSVDADANIYALYLDRGPDGAAQYDHVVRLSPLGTVQAFVVPGATSNNSSSIHSAPVSLNGQTFFGSDNGNLYGIDTASGANLPGFPFDARANGASATSKILGRPALRVSNGVLSLFFVTDDGYAFRVNTDGTKAWSVGPVVAGAANVQTTPAVAPGEVLETVAGSPYAGSAAVSISDSVFVAAGTGTAAYVVKLSAANGATLQTSGSLGTDIKSSPAVDAAGLGVFVGVSGGSDGALRLSTSDLTPLNQYATGKSAVAPPFILFGASHPIPAVYVVTSDSQVVAADASTGTPSGGFDGDGVKALSPATTVVAAPYVYNNVVYVGGQNNKVYAVDASTGAGVGPAGADVLFNNTRPGAINGGVTVDPGATGGAALIFGDSLGVFYRVKIADPAQYRAFQIGAYDLDTAAGIDPLSAVFAPNGTDTVLNGSLNNRLFRYPR